MIQIKRVELAKKYYYLVGIFLLLWTSSIGLSARQNTCKAMTTAEFDPVFYVNKYRDLKRVIGNDCKKLKEHWKIHGMKEGRQSAPNFSIKDYLIRYPDLQKAFGVTNYKRAMQHWYEYGKGEKRDASPRSAACAALTTYEFDPLFYVSKYRDLKRVIGNDWKKLKEHWEIHGLKEGRQSAPEFAIKGYLKRYPDLQKAFGANNYKAAYKHWFDYGKKEKRNPKKLLVLPPAPDWMVNTRKLKVEFFNESGYVARYSVYYNGKWRWKSGSVTLGFRKSVEVPATATDVRIKGEANHVISWSTIFDKKIDLNGADYCTKTYGTAFAPKYNHNCRAWNPFSNTKVHIANHTGEKLYAGWSTEVDWSKTNVVAGGVVIGLLLENMHNLNANFYKYMIMAASGNLELPRSTYELFKKASIAINPNSFKPVVEHSPLNTVKTLFDVKTGPLAYIAELTVKTAEQSDEYKSRNLQFNPILVAAGSFGAETMTVMVVNESLTKYWVINTGIDDSWIIKPDKVVKAKYGTINQVEANGKSVPSSKLKLSN